MDELIPINVPIADRSYRLKIKRNDEEAVRKTVKLINEKIVEFKASFAGKDVQDYIAMVLLWLASELTNGNQALLMSYEANHLCDEIEALLDKSINS